MTKQHLKSLYAPKTWDIARKENIFTTRPKPGAHPFRLGVSINHLLKKNLGFASTTKESKTLLNNGSCYVNCKLVKNVHYLVGFMDSLSFPEIKKHYRVVLSEKGKVTLIEIDEKESKLKLSKITNKTLVKGGKFQLNTMDGRNILIKEDKYNTSDSILLDLESGEIKKSIALKEKATIMLIGGKHIGFVGQIENIDNNKVFFKNNKNDQTYETLKKFVFVIGESKSELKVQ
ncbi:MAG: 30S ribosomal protein S4e [Candidatus Woesearchaeota archaeon]